MRRRIPTPGPINRRDALRLGFAAGGVSLFSVGSALSKGTGGSAASSVVLPPSFTPSPPTTPFVEAMPVAPIARPVAPFPTAADPFTTNVDGSTAFHISRARAVPPLTDFYRIEQRAALHSFHPQLRPNVIWGYNGHTPGPTFFSTSGRAILARFVNNLPTNDTLGIGTPISAVHHHGGVQAPEDDGYPVDTFYAGQSRDYLYPNLPEDGLVQNEQSTTWYHDHAIDVTAENVYRGLAGFYLNFDKLDSLAGEEDANFGALKLPGRMRIVNGAPVRDYDIPVVVCDRQFDANGYLTYNSFEHDGFLGDKFLANGKIQPFLNVERRKYRFRFCNGANARIFDFFLSNNAPFDFVIATDDNLLEAPIKGVQNFRMAPGERVEVIIDFSKYAAGTTINFENRLVQTNGRKPDGLSRTGTPIIQFRVGGPAVVDPSRVPTSLRPLSEPVALLLPKVKVQRTFVFGRSNGAWTINGQFFDENRIDAKPKRGEPEIWSLESGGGWIHPVHIHLSSFFILSRDGKTPPLLERGRKDTVRIGADEKDVKILIKFANYTGRYAFHCHNIEHEDMRMMGQFEVQP
jgi:FtsP/CotA-like multicopper oxidase with cupredoxin domain